MLPAWATVLIAVAGSAVGGVVGAMLQTRHERSEGIRERMLIAASDFSIKIGHALSLAVAVSNDVDEWGRDGGGRPPAEVADAVAAARQDLGEADEVISRIDLLFGVMSDARLRAVDTAHALGRFFGHFDEWPPSDGYEDDLTDADHGYLIFNLEARKEIERYGSALPRTWRR